MELRLPELRGRAGGPAGVRGPYAGLTRIELGRKEFRPRQRLTGRSRPSSTHTCALASGLTTLAHQSHPPHEWGHGPRTRAVLATRIVAARALCDKLGAARSRRERLRAHASPLRGAAGRSPAHA